MSDQQTIPRTSALLAHGAGPVLSVLPSGSQDIASFCGGYCEWSDPHLLFCLSAGRNPLCSSASRAAVDALQEQMSSFQAAMQKQMEAIASFMVNQQPLIVPSLPQEPQLASSVQPVSSAIPHTTTDQAVPRSFSCWCTAYILFLKQLQICSLRKFFLCHHCNHLY